MTARDIDPVPGEDGELQGREAGQLYSYKGEICLELGIYNLHASFHYLLSIYP